MRDRGSMSVFTALVMTAVVAATLSAVEPVLGDLVAHQRARAAADAAALAGVVDGRGAAERFAAANGGVLVSYSESGDEVFVVVEVAGRRARARATDAP